MVELGTLAMFTTVALLVVSNVFMTFAWYRHLRVQSDAPLYVAVLTSWVIALFEYCFAVPANRMGARHFDLAQLKVLQEVISLAVFAVVARLAFGQALRPTHALSALCLVGAVWFAFRE
jgi:uncharacterized protein